MMGDEKAMLHKVQKTLCGYIIIGGGRGRGHHPKAVVPRVRAGLGVSLYVSDL